MSEPDLFSEPYGGTPPFEASSDTSRDAAASMAPTAGTLRAKVLEFIRGQPPVRWMETIGWVGGATDEEIEQALGLMHQTASARRRELVLQGLVREVGFRYTRSKRKANVWEAV